MVVHSLREEWEPKYPGAWGEWPVEYLQGLMTIARYKYELMGLWKWQAETTPELNKRKLDELTGFNPVEREAQRKAQAAGLKMMHGGKSG